MEAKPPVACRWSLDEQFKAEATRALAEATLGAKAARQAAVVGLTTQLTAKAEGERRSGGGGGGGDGAGDPLGSAKKEEAMRRLTSELASRGLPASLLDGWEVGP